ncbi:hypothetical protein CTEN210_10354 [Chaetoceros tenuissimus]|uniref:RING-type domain-containing protein n=1 Tax=Chaetoceros tenuissimus TaxID=426638 RepID=A0AAD3CXK2_9STRA|nr:hypothetical protein CTEN210_10354 [Chaetoceros tenuissimus]
MDCCSICLDEEESLTFKCSSISCKYQLCTTCIKHAFNDHSGTNASNCHFCGSPSAMAMISSLCGEGAIKAVEQKLRSSLEFEYNEKLAKKKDNERLANTRQIKARQIFNRITEDINLKCPRCSTVFHDYDGCNALKCRVDSCNAAFCAICLHDCGDNAHPHVREKHGNVFDKKAFTSSVIKREKAIIDKHLESLVNEPSDLVLMVKNHIEKAELGKQKGQSKNSDRTKSEKFLSRAKRDLFQTVKLDRLSILSNPDEYKTRNFRIYSEKLNARSSIPTDFRVSLIHQYGSTYALKIVGRDNMGNRVPLDLNDLSDFDRNGPKVEALSNLKQGIKCAVVAFEGHKRLYQTGSVKPAKDEQLQDHQVSLSLKSVNEDGSVDIETNFYGEEFVVLGLNPNQRMVLLEKHVQDSQADTLLFPSLRHLVGDGSPKTILDQLSTGIPDTFFDLNKEQQSVAHPLLLKSAREVAGPPGTGKTKTIVELVKALLETTDKEIIVLSERNGAINAIAEKFCDVALKKVTKQKGKGPFYEVVDMQVWLSLITYGSADGMGLATKLFTIEEKLKLHPEIVELTEKVSRFSSASMHLVRTMKSRLSTAVLAFGLEFNERNANERSEGILEDKVVLMSPLQIIRYIQSMANDISTSLNEKLSEKQVDSIVSNYGTVLNRLIEVRPDPEKEISSWNAKLAQSKLEYLKNLFQEVLSEDIFDETNANELCDKRSSAEHDLRKTKERLKIDLPDKGRLFMSTIGSSHKISTMKERELEDQMDLLSLEDSSAKETVVIFDEAGCIPSFELLGLSRLGRDIQSIVLVGDKNQLPPYNPSNNSNVSKTKNRRGNNFVQNENNDSLKSLLDVSNMSMIDEKILLKTQYRVPKDIADLLNVHVYKGDYITCPNSPVPARGLNIVHCMEDYSENRKYINLWEVDKALSLFYKLKRDASVANILIITPYKKQQRELQHRFKKEVEEKEIPTILTIDQCQGQEADAVILSMVQKPTKFLTKCRLNVAISRVRKKLYVLIDTHKLRDACENHSWETALFARALLSDYDPTG